MIDWRFPMALQIVLSLAVTAERGLQCTSQELASGLGANPSHHRFLTCGCVFTFSAKQLVVQAPVSKLNVPTL